MSTPADTAHAADNVRLLPGDGDGILSTPAGDALAVRTFRRGADVVLVRLESGDGLSGDDALPDADLQYSSARGVVHLHGEARFEGPAVIRFQPDGDAEITQRRSHVRVPAPQLVTVDAGGADELHARAVDLSGSGMLLRGAPDLQRDQILAFSIALDPAEPPAEGTARVAGVRADGDCALAFESITEHERERLIRFVFTRMRAERARTSGDHR
jgi:hypothetical protein